MKLHCVGLKLCGGLRVGRESCIVRLKREKNLLASVHLLDTAGVLLCSQDLAVRVCGEAGTALWKCVCVLRWNSVVSGRK